MVNAPSWELLCHPAGTCSPRSAAEPASARPPARRSQTRNASRTHVRVRESRIAGLYPAGHVTLMLTWATFGETEGSLPWLRHRHAAPQPRSRAAAGPVLGAPSGRPSRIADRGG